MNRGPLFGIFDTQQKTDRMMTLCKVTQKSMASLLWTTAILLSLSLPTTSYALNPYSQSYMFEQCKIFKDSRIAVGDIIQTDCRNRITAHQTDAYDGVYDLLYLHNNSMFGWTQYGNGYPWILDGAGEASNSKSRSCPKEGCSKGDPINPTVGNSYDTVVEYSGSGAFPLQFAWTYNSSGAGIVETPDSVAIGSNRTHTYQRNVQMVPSSTLAGVMQTSAEVAGADGNVEKYVQSGSAWIADADNANTLIGLLDAQSHITGWEHHLLSGDVEYYGSDGKLTRITNRAGLSQTLGYDSQGRLLTVTDPFGRSLIFGYNTLNEITSVSLPDGRVIGFTYSQGNLVTVTHPDLTTTRYLYAESGLVDPNDTLASQALTGIVDEKGARYSTTTYDSQHRAINTFLVGGVDRFDFVYQPTGNTTLMAQTTVTGPLGKTEIFSNIATFGTPHVAGVTQSCTGCTSTSRSNTFDANGRLYLATDFNGVTTETDYDSGGLLKQVIRGKGTAQQQTETRLWDPTFREPTQIDRAGQRQTFTYNSRGQVLTSTLTDTATSATRTTTTTYCEQADVTAGTCPIIGLIKSVADPLSHATTYTYYPSDDSTCVSAPTTCPHRVGDLWKVTNALNQVTQFLTYDGAGRVLSMQDPNGVITNTSYNARGWLTQRSVLAGSSPGAGDHITVYAYDNAGQATRVTQPDASYTTFGYDVAHRLTDVTDNLGNTIHYTLDNAGNRTKDDTKDSSGTLARTLSRMYNGLGQLQQSLNAQSAATAYTYDANGNPYLTTDALSRVTEQDYDPLNRLMLTLQDKGDSTHLNVFTKYAYDARDHLTQVTDPQGLNTIYQYDGLDNLTKLTSPDTGVTTYTYDASGNLKTKADPRPMTGTFNYDALNRLTGITWSNNNSASTYIYDAVPNLVGTTTPACATGENFSVGRLSQTTLTQPITGLTITTQMCYDRFGNTVRKLTTTGGKTLTTRYVHDLAGHVTQTITPAATTVTYARDTAGRIIKLSYRLSGQTTDTTVVSNVTYYPFGPVKQISYANGRTLNRSYDQDYVVSSVLDSASGGLDYTFSRNANGNLIQLQSAVGNNVFGYDNLDRLTGVNTTGTNALVAAYTYDGTGNRTSKKNGTAAPQMYTYPLNSHQLIDAGGIGRIYDPAGNTTQITGALKFVYAATGRMSQLKNGSGTNLQNYEYNASGERLRKFVPGTQSTSVYFGYDQYGHLLGDYANGSGSIMARQHDYLWLDDLPVGLLTGTTGVLSYIEPDHLGTPRAVIDPTRNVAIWKWALANDAFGESAPQQDPDGDGTQFVFNLRMPGQYFDAESGLNYNYFRDYDAGTGRYVESDPIGQKAGYNTYTYVLSRPMDVIDPAGLACKRVSWLGAPRGDYTRFVHSPTGTVADAGGCVMLPQVVTPTAIDLIPSLDAASRGEFPFSIPVSLGWWCQTTFYRLTRLEQMFVQTDLEYEVCTNCGITTKTLLANFKQLLGWRPISTSYEQWSERRFIPVGGIPTSDPNILTDFAIPIP